MPEEPSVAKKQVELLEKAIALQLFALGAPQSAIAKALNKSKTWGERFVARCAERKDENSWQDKELANKPVIQSLTN